MPQRSSDKLNMDLIQEIILKFNQLERPSTVLINTSTTMVAKTNFFLLKGLLDLEDEKGFFVALDRPYQNMDYLLSNHNIDREKIWYIDTATHLSGERKKDKKNVDFVNKSFEIERLVDVFKDDNDRDGFGSLSEVNFVLIENLSPMLNYNSLEKIEEFVDSFTEMINRHDHLLGCLVMDSEAHEELYEVVRKYVSEVIDVKDLKEEL